MSKTPKYDAKVKAILDSTKPGERTCKLTGEKWVMDEREIGWYKKFNVPPSKYSPTTRQKLLYSFFVMFDIWYNKHAETGKPMISNIHPATGIRVLPDAEWFARDFTSDAQDLDLSKPFLDQFYTLTRAVPRAAGYHYVLPENSIAFISLGDQDSYFVLACKSKRTFYSINAQNVEDSAEVSILYHGQNAYNAIHSDRIFHCRFVRESTDCLDCDFIFDCRNCQCCFMATNQRNKKYVWFNEQLTKEEWERRHAEVDLRSFASRKNYEKQFRDLIEKSVWPENFNINAENCTGEYLTNVSNIKDGYFAMAAGSRDIDLSAYIVGPPSHDSYLCAAIMGSANCYYGVGMSNSDHAYFSCSINSAVQESEYCETCYDVQNCFGCVGLRKKQFCILNKQYKEAEYWRILDVLKCAMLERGEYGDLPLANFSTQLFSGSGAAILFGATAEDGRRLGAAEFKPEDEGAEGLELPAATIRSVDEIPDRIESDQIDELAGKPFWDKQMGRRFAYLKPELEFYQKLRIAPPRRHPTGRIHDLYREMNRPIFHNTICAKCQKAIRVADNQAYSKRTIYCQSCYLRYLEERG